MRLVVVNGKGTLVADVDALTRDGKSVSKTGLAIAEVDLSGASVKDGVFSAQNAAVALTAEGSTVLFAGQYRGADNAMAPLSFSVKLSEQTAENTVEVPRVSENKSSDNKGSENGSSDNSSSNSSDNSGANGSGSNGSAGTSGSVSNGGSSSNGSVSTTRHSLSAYPSPAPARCRSRAHPTAPLRAQTLAGACVIPSATTCAAASRTVAGS